ncbi:MAG: tyrosine-type recombinase/integrase [Chloroflexota bacterium]|nr:tyrosine-type recombinase/integrase [Chloroflexota bacterium]
MQNDIDRFLQVLETERGFSVNTIYAYRNDLSQFLVYLRPGPDDATGAGTIANRQIDRMAGLASSVSTWEELTDGHLTTYLLHLRGRSYAAATVARKTAAIKSFCNYLLTEGRMRSDPAANMASPKVDRYTPRSITRAEINRLLAQPGAGDPDHAGRPEAIRDRAMLEALYATGMRVSELVALDSDDVNLANGELRAGPAGRYRIIALRERATRAVDQYLRAARPTLDLRSEAALFLNHRGRRLTRQGFWLILKSYAQQAKISGITPHTLRHTFAAHRLSEGAELSEVQRILGHVNISTTQVYQRLMANGLDQSYHELEPDAGVELDAGSAIGAADEAASTVRRDTPVPPA